MFVSLSHKHNNVIKYCREQPYRAYTLILFIGGTLRAYTSVFLPGVPINKFTPLESFSTSVFLLAPPITIPNVWLKLHLCRQTSIIRGFLGQNLVRPTFLQYSQTSIIRGPRSSAVFNHKIFSSQVPWIIEV